MIDFVMGGCMDWVLEEHERDKRAARKRREKEEPKKKK
jgi:hypothetical protein